MFAEKIRGGTAPSRGNPCRPGLPLEVKFWAEIQLEGVDYNRTARSGGPQNALSQLVLAHSKELQRITADGPRYLKFFSLIKRKSAELGVLCHESYELFVAHKQHLESGGNFAMALTLDAQRVVLARKILAKYNQCIRLAKKTATYPERWALGRAISEIPKGIGSYLVTLRAEGRSEIAEKFEQSILQISRLAVWISVETGDSNGVAVALISALMGSQSRESNPAKWAESVVANVRDPNLAGELRRSLDRVYMRWSGRKVEGDIEGDTAWQLIQNMATGLGIDVSDENSPTVRYLKVAARDNSPERVLRNCEHIMTSLGATGPYAREIGRIFNITTAGSKIVHCVLHGHHVEGKDYDAAYREFENRHCSNCPDRNRRPDGWRLTATEYTRLKNLHREFIEKLVGTQNGYRFVDTDQ